MSKHFCIIWLQGRGLQVRTGAGTSGQRCSNCSSRAVRNQWKEWLECRLQHAEWHRHMNVGVYIPCYKPGSRHSEWYRCVISRRPEFEVLQLRSRPRQCVTTPAAQCPSTCAHVHKGGTWCTTVHRACVSVVSIATARYRGRPGDGTHDAWIESQLQLHPRLPPHRVHGAYDAQTTWLPDQD